MMGPSIQIHELALTLNVNNNGSVLYLARVSIHLSCVDHQAAIVAPGSRHEPFPSYTVKAVNHETEDIKPRLVGDKVSDETSTGT